MIGSDDARRAEVGRLSRLNEGAKNVLNSLGSSQNEEAREVRHLIHKREVAISDIN